MNTAGKLRAMGDLRDHLQLITRMARATGTDLVAASDAGTLSQQDWAAMVQTCRQCDWAAYCADWLDGHDRIARAPDTCPNRDRLACLKDAALLSGTKEGV